MENINNRYNIFKNDTYINWLDKFSLEHRFFYEDSWGDECTYLSDRDKNRASKISLLLLLISNYCKSYGFKGYIEDRELTYPFRHNDNYYIIGIDANEQITFCRRVNSGDDSYVNYDNVKKYHIDNKDNNKKAIQ